MPYGDYANSLNKFMSNQAIQPFVQNLPGYASMVGQRSENTQSMLKGQLPQDVVNQITQRAAERGIGSGVSGSNNSNSALLSALGLSSLDLMGKGSQQLTQSIADTPTPEIWNPAALLVPQTLAQQEIDAAKEAQQNTINAGGYSRQTNMKDGTYTSSGGGNWIRQY